MVIKLREILEIKPGTLIKGLHIGISGSVSLSLEGWDFEQKTLVKTVWSLTDREIFRFCYYNNTRLETLLTDSKIIKYQIDNINYFTLRKNGEAYYKDIKGWIEQEDIKINDCIGLSLGENILAIQPHSADIYRPDFFEIFLFHKILHGDKIKWIVIQSKKVVSKNTLMSKAEFLLFDIPMELI